MKLLVKTHRFSQISGNTFLVALVDSALSYRTVIFATYLSVELFYFRMFLLTDPENRKDILNPATVHRDLIRWYHDLGNHLPADFELRVS